MSLCYIIYIGKGFALNSISAKRRKHVKRFSKTLSIFLVVALMVFSLSGCTTAKVEATPEIKTVAAVEVPAAPAPAPAPAPVPAPAPEAEPTPEPEVAPVEEAPVEEIAATPLEDVEIVYPYGVKEVVKNDKGDDNFDLFIVHTNDVHARVDDYIGYSKLSTMLNTARSITDNLLVLDAGDTIHGTNFANLFNGETVGELLIQVGYDAICPGNHEFNYGLDNLLALADYAEKNSDLRVLCANCTDENGYLLFQPYQVYNFNGFRVAVIGLTTPETKVKSHPKNTEGVDFMSDMVVQNAQYAIDMAHELVDYVVVLGHIGVDEESDITSEWICENIDGIDLFIDGHSHTVLGGEDALRVNGTLIVSAGEHMKNVGVVEINVRDGKAVSEYSYLITQDDVLHPEDSELVDMIADLTGFRITAIPNDPEVDAYIDAVNAKVDELMSVPVAELDQRLDGERADVRSRKTNLSKLLCEAMTEAGGADLTITNGGGIRASIDAGIVTRGDVFNVLPFNNSVITCEISGADIYAALEHGYRALPDPSGSYAQTDAKVVYSKNAEPGQRIKRVILPNGEKVEMDKTYLVATNDFMAAGGDGYTMFGKEVKSGINMSEVFEAYLAKMFPIK